MQLILQKQRTKCSQVTNDEESTNRLSSSDSMVDDIESYRLLHQQLLKVIASKDTICTIISRYTLSKKSKPTVNVMHHIRKLWPILTS